MSKARSSLIAPSCHGEPSALPPRPTTMSLRRITTSVAAATSLAAAVGVGYALGSDPDDDVPPSSPPISLANADLTVAASCDALLDSYVDRALERVGPYGWGGG